MKIIGERLRSLRESVRLSQAKLAKEFDVSQSALARYEIDDSTPSPEVFLKYADYFDVSLDYIFGRTDDPHGMIYNNCVKLGLNNPEMARFVEMCFDPGSAIFNAPPKGAQKELASRAKRALFAACQPANPVGFTLGKQGGLEPLFACWGNLSPSSQFKYSST